MVGAHPDDARGQVVARQMSLQGCGGHVCGKLLLVDADNGDTLCGSQKWRGIMYSACGQPASVPGDADVLRFKRAFTGIRNKNDRAARLKKYFLRYGVVEGVVVRFWLQHDRQVVESRQC